MNEKKTSQSSAGNHEVSLWDVIRLLLRKCYWLLIAAILCAGLVYLAVSLLVTPTYESRVSFYVYNGANSTPQNGTINNSDLQAAESLATTYSKILESNSVLDAVLDDLGETGISRKELSRMVAVSVVTDTQLLEVVVTSTSPEFACRIADSFASVAPTEIIRITRAGGVEVVDRPEVATEKSAPRTIFDSAIGAVVGVIIAAVIIILRALSDTTIYLPEDIAALAGITVLGQIPAIDVSANSKFTAWTLLEGGAEHHAEQEKQS